MKIPINNSEKEKPAFDFTTIETFEDACDVLGLDALNLPNLSAISKRFKKSLLAYYKLMVIFEAINNGWIPDFSISNQKKIVPTFEIDPSGLAFSHLNLSAFVNNSKSSTLLCCGNPAKVKYITLKFEGLFQDYLLISKSRPDEAAENRKVPGLTIREHTMPRIKGWH
jgi:hypothetical protein